MAPENQARTNAVRQYMAENSVNYTTALRAVNSSREPAQVVAEPTLRADLDWGAGMDEIARRMLARDGGDGLPPGSRYRRPKWLDLDRLSTEEQAFVEQWLRAGWGYRDEGPAHWPGGSYLRGPRCRTLADTKLAGAYVTSGSGNVPEFGVLVFRGGGAMVVPAGIGRAADAPPPAPKAAGYIRRLVARMDEYAVYLRGSTPRDDVYQWARASMRPANANQKLIEYHPSMEVGSRPPLTGAPDRDLAWYRAGGLSVSARKIIDVFLDTDVPRYWPAPPETVTMLDVLMTRGARAASSFMFGEGRNAVSFGVIAMPERGAIAVPAALATHADLPPLEPRAAAAARRYGVSLGRKMVDGRFEPFSNWGDQRPSLSRVEVLAHPPETEESYRLWEFTQEPRQYWNWNDALETPTGLEPV